MILAATLAAATLATAAIGALHVSGQVLLQGTSETLDFRCFLYNSARTAHFAASGIPRETVEEWRETHWTANPDALRQVLPSQFGEVPVMARGPQQIEAELPFLEAVEAIERDEGGVFHLKIGGTSFPFLVPPNFGDAIDTVCFSGYRTR